MAKIISIMNQKGGVAKTTTAANLAGGLAMAGKKVLLIDDDAQGSLTLYFFGDRPNGEKGTLAGLYRSFLNGSPFDYENSIYETSEQGIDIIPGNKTTQRICDELPYDPSSNKYYLILNQILEPLKNQYDYILIDCDGAFNKLTTNAFVASDSVLIPIRPGFMEVNGFDDLMEEIQNVRKKLNRNLKVEGVVTTMVDGRSNLTKDMIAEIHRQCGENGLLKAEIPYTAKVGEASAAGSTMFVYAPKHKATQAYQQLTDEVLKNG